MIKSARKPSSDPVQEKLRQSKANWNKEVSSFVNDLIHYKKLMNGWPNKFHMEKSRIVDPIPADPATIVGALVGDFTEIAQRGNEIIQQQIDYSKNRRKRQMKQLNLPLGSPANTNQVPDLSHQLSLPLAASFEEKYNLIAEGSNPISRLFSRVRNLSFGVTDSAVIKKHRMSMLSSCAKTYKDLEKLQVAVVKSSKDSLKESHDLLTKTWNDWSAMYQKYSSYKLNMPKATIDTDGVPPIGRSKNEESTSEKPIIGKPIDNTQTNPAGNDNIGTNLKAIKSILNDYKTVVSTNRFPEDVAIFQEFNDLYAQMTMAQPDKKLPFLNKLLDFYVHLLGSLNQKYATNEPTLLQIADARDKNSFASFSPIEKVAQDFLKKWFGKVRHQLSIFDDTSVYRLEIYKVAESLRTTLDQIMDLLEEDLNISALDPLILEVNGSLVKLRSLVRAIYNSENSQEKFDRAKSSKNR